MHSLLLEHCFSREFLLLALHYIFLLGLHFHTKRHANKWLHIVFGQEQIRYTLYWWKTALSRRESEFLFQFSIQFSHSRFLAARVHQSTSTVGTRDQGDTALLVSLGPRAIPHQKTFGQKRYISLPTSSEKANWKRVLTVPLVREHVSTQLK